MRRISQLLTLYGGGKQQQQKKKNSPPNNQDDTLVPQRVPVEMVASQPQQEPSAFFRDMQLEFAFLSHQQEQAGDQTASNAARLQRVGIKAWTDQRAEKVTGEEMQKGVLQADVFILFLTTGVGRSWFTALEISTAIKNNKRIVCLVEEDPMQGVPLFKRELNDPSELNKIRSTPVNKRDVCEALFKFLGKDSKDDVLRIDSLDSVDALCARLNIDQAVTFVRTQDPFKEAEFIGNLFNVPADKVVRVDDAKIEFYIVCHLKSGYDAAFIIQQEIAIRFNIRGAIVMDAADLPAANQAIDTLIVMVSDDVFTSDVVATAIQRANRITLVHESDHRRFGAAECRELFNGDELKWMQNELMKQSNKTVSDAIEHLLKRRQIVNANKTFCHTIQNAWTPNVTRKESKAREIVGWSSCIRPESLS